jgi:hypothetical protein
MRQLLPVLLCLLLSLPAAALEELKYTLRGDGGIANQTGADLDESSIHCQNLKVA